VDEKPQVVKENPWLDENPLALLEGLEKDKLRQAFQVKGDASDLRRGGDTGKLPVGVEVCTWGPSYDPDKLPGLGKKPESVARREKIVDPGATADTAGVYQNLAQALA